MDTRGPISEAGQIAAKAAKVLLARPGAGPIRLQRQMIADEIDHVLHRIRIDVAQPDDYVAIAGKRDERGILRKCRSLIRTKARVAQTAGMRADHTQRQINGAAVSTTSVEALTEEISKATFMAFTELFAIGEHFYYCALITTGEAHAPFISAWSEEALERYAIDCNCDDREKNLIRWSYAESPYLDFGSRHFDSVRRLFELRPQMNHMSSDVEWQHEFDIRVRAMEAAMKELNDQGVFGAGRDRSKLVINVEVMPPDYGNTQRAIRLNPLSALSEWLLAAAEPIPGAEQEK